MRGLSHDIAPVMVTDHHYCAKTIRRHLFEPPTSQFPVHPREFGAYESFEADSAVLDSRTYPHQQLPHTLPIYRPCGKLTVFPSQILPPRSPHPPIEIMTHHKQGHQSLLQI